MRNASVINVALYESVRIAIPSLSTFIEDYLILDDNCRKSVILAS